MKACSSMNRAKVYCKQAYRLTQQGGSTQDQQDQLLRRSKKMLTHSLRYLHFGIQLAESGRIQDYMVANPYWEEMRPMTSLVWEDYERRFRPTYIHLMDQFPKDPVKPMDQANSVPALYRRFFCYLRSPEQTGARSQLSTLEKEVLHILIEERKAAIARDRMEGDEQGKREKESEPNFATIFPEHAPLYDNMKERFEQLCTSIQSAYDDVVRHIRGDGKKKEKGEEEKAFAKRVLNEEWKSILFRIWRDRTTAYDVVLKSALKNIHHWLTMHDLAKAST